MLKVILSSNAGISILLLSQHSTTTNCHLLAPWTAWSRTISSTISWDCQHPAQRQPQTNLIFFSWGKLLIWAASRVWANTWYKLGIFSFWEMIAEKNHFPGLLCQLVQFNTITVSRTYKGCPIRRCYVFDSISNENLIYDSSLHIKLYLNLLL